MNLDFERRYWQLREDAVNYLKQLQTTKFWEYSDAIGIDELHENNDRLYDLPRHFYVDKYSVYYEYAITGFENNEGELWFDATGISEAYGHDMKFSIHEIELPLILDIIQAIEHNTEYKEYKQANV